VEEDEEDDDEEEVGRAGRGHGTGDVEEVDAEGAVGGEPAEAEAVDKGEAPAAASDDEE
jgi:hypothetical protein